MPKIAICIAGEELTEGAFELRKAAVQKALSDAGWPSGTPIIPVSPSKGGNILKPSSKMTWYSRETVLKVLDSTTVEEHLGKPLRFVVTGVYMDRHLKAVVTIGRVEQGVLRRQVKRCILMNQQHAELLHEKEMKNGQMGNTQIQFWPSGIKAKIGIIEASHQRIDQATRRSSEYIGIALEGIPPKLKRAPKVGEILTMRDDLEPVGRVVSFIAR